MPGRGRRIAVALVVLALLLSAGRWGSSFVAERLWESAIAARVAQAGARRALLSLALEVTVLLLASLWLFMQYAIAARIALPDKPPPERDAAKTWPPQLPRWFLAVAALVVGVLVGSGAGGWLDELRLTVDGVRLGVLGSPLGADLGIFVRQVPLWLDLQRKAMLLLSPALAGVILLHLAGGTIRGAGWRIGISPRARGQLAILLALLALTLGWGAALEPYRLAAGLRGPLLSSEFVMRSSVSRIQFLVALVAALISFLWWFKARGSAVLAFWGLFLLALLIGSALPRHAEAATADPTWQAAARGLDSVAFQLAGLDLGDSVRTPADSILPTLWDDIVLAPSAADSGALSELRRGWLEATQGAEPVWLAVRESRGKLPELLALSDKQVSPTGDPLAWREGDAAPAARITPFRVLAAHSVRPLADRIELAPDGPGVRLEGWARRLVLAWALQAPVAFSGASGSRITWRLDPATRLRAIAPFAYWTPPRARIMGAGLVWQSDGMLSSGLFPSSTRIVWSGGRVSMVRSAFIGLVNAVSGEVRIFQRDPADSLAAAWARISRPLIEQPGAIPRELRVREAYPEELLRAQLQALEGPAWHRGRLERHADGSVLLPPPAPGGAEHLVPLLHAADLNLGALLLARRTPTGDSLRLIPLDSLWTVESSAKLKQRWEHFPFQQQLSESAHAAGGLLVTGAVRFARAVEGIVAYQPAWAVDAAGRAQLVLVNVGIGKRNGAEQMSLGTGRNLPEAWLNYHHLMSPSTWGASAERILEQARALLRHADSALRHGDAQERERTLANLRRLLEPGRP